LLASRSFDPFDASPIEPFPSALRFLGAHAVLPNSQIIDGVSRLARSSDPKVRWEAATTVVLLASRQTRPELLVLAISLAGDADALVRATGGRAIAFFLSTRNSLADLALNMVRELLDADGLLAPRLILQGLKDSGVVLPDIILSHVREMAEWHPGQSVRSAALALLQEVA